MGDIAIDRVAKPSSVFYSMWLSSSLCPIRYTIGRAAMNYALASFQIFIALFIIPISLNIVASERINTIIQAKTISGFSKNSCTQWSLGIIPAC